MAQFPLYTKSKQGEFYKTTSKDTTIVVRKFQYSKTGYSYSITIIKSVRKDEHHFHTQFSESSNRDEFEKLYEEAHWHINKANIPA
jgi:hypothetical protein